MSWELYQLAEEIKWELLRLRRSRRLMIKCWVEVAKGGAESINRLTSGLESQFNGSNETEGSDHV